jgi:hypothetical protein
MMTGSDRSVPSEPQRIVAEPIRVGAPIDGRSRNLLSQSAVGPATNRGSANRVSERNLLS